MLDENGVHITGTLPETDQGLGDTVARVIHSTGLDKLATIYTQVTGKPCNCGARQEVLNALFPYKQP